MCTAINYRGARHLFGRTLDLECGYDEQIVITPRRFACPFRHEAAPMPHYAILGMATVQDGFPLYYDALNEKGLCAAALRFPETAIYLPPAEGAENIAPFELILHLLGKYATVAECMPHLANLRIADTAFSRDFPNTPLHWLLADKNEAVVLEPCADGLHIHQNPVGVLTNAPPFECQMTNLRTYMHLSAYPQVNRFEGVLPDAAYSRGLGAFGLPGDLSSASRFVRAAFALQNSVAEADVAQFFHIMETVSQTRGLVRLDGKYEKTVYTSCADTAQGIYYYTTYENRRITAIHLHRAPTDGDALMTYPLRRTQDIYTEN